MEIFGFLGIITTIMLWIPQLYKIIKTKSVKDLSLATYSILFIDTLLWLIHGIMIKDTSLLAINIFGIIVKLTLLILIIFFHIKNKKNK